MVIPWGPILGAGASILGSVLTADSNRSATNTNMDFQRQFAQHGVRWRVADAEAAGINPLAALGANISQATPVAVGTSFDRMGQDIGDVLRHSLDTNRRKLEAIKIEAAEEELKQLKLTNAGLRKQINTDTAAPIPGIAIPGQSDSVNINPKEQTIQSTLGVEAGLPATNQRTVDKHGRVLDSLSQPLQEALENDTFTNLKYFIYQVGDYARGIKTSLNPGKNMEFVRVLRNSRPRAQNPAYEFRWNEIGQVWQLYKKNGRTQLFSRKEIDERLNTYEKNYLRNLRLPHSRK